MEDNKKLKDVEITISESIYYLSLIEDLVIDPRVKDTISNVISNLEDRLVEIQQD